MHILVTGGAGYIGSHTVIQLIEAGHEVSIVDSFVNSSTAVLPRIEALVGRPIVCHRVDLVDEHATDALFAASNVGGVIHFAGHKAVGESVAKPIDYYANNLGSTLSLLRAMTRHGVFRLVFSSSATVYGASPRVPATEDLPTSATNPYGWSKVMIEQLLRDAASADERWRIAVLRYFNPGGAHPSGTIGEDSGGTPNNVLPNIADVAVGRLGSLRVFGSDYDTPDGTGVRDFIHVEDLAAGHIAALNHLETMGTALRTWNLGTGKGTSVLELVRAFEQASGHRISYEVVDRRPGDVGECYADASRAADELGWQASRTIEDICVDAWRWQSANPDGYPAF